MVGCPRRLGCTVAQARGLESGSWGHSPVPCFLPGLSGRSDKFDSTFPPVTRD